MSKKILYQQDNGRIAILNPANGVDIDEVLLSVPNGAQKIVVEESQLPNNDDLYHFFDALTVDFSSAAINFDLTISKEITKQRLRKERSSLFEKNDLAIRDAMLENNTDALNLAITERNRLRDITKLADSASNLSELKDLHP